MSIADALTKLRETASKLNESKVDSTETMVTESKKEEMPENIDEVALGNTADSGVAKRETSKIKAGLSKGKINKQIFQSESQEGDEDDLGELDEGKITVSHAKEVLNAHGGQGTDFFSLKHDHISGLLDHAKKVGYKQPANASGSKARYFHSYLSRVAARNESEEFNLDDYTLDEINEFMASEDFEQLDELSKTTLGNYIRSAGNKRVVNAKKNAADERDFKKIDTAVKNGSGSDPDREISINKLRSNHGSDVKRRIGINGALRRLTKEDVQLDLGDLFEGQDLSEEFKTKVTTIFEAAVATRVNTEVEKIEESLAQVALDESVEFKNGLENKIDGYLGYMAEQWLKNNVVALDRGIKAELFESFMNGMKGLFNEHNVNVPESDLTVIDELNSKVEELTNKINESTAKNVELSQIIKEVARQSQIEEAVQGLSDIEIEKFKTLAEELAYEDETSFGKKLTVIRENYFSKKPKNESTKTLAESVITDEPINEEKTAVVNKLSPTMAAYDKALSRTKI